jgi:hypothetical protein
VVMAARVWGGRRWERGGGGVQEKGEGKEAAAIPRGKGGAARVRERLVGQIEIHGPTRLHDSSRPTILLLYWWMLPKFVILVNASQISKSLKRTTRKRNKTKHRKNKLQLLFFANRVSQFLCVPIH